MHSSAYRLGRAACHAAAKPNSAALVTAASSAAGKQAMEELGVYLRAMKTAQRRWAREIVTHETNVRRLMMVEEQCRERLKQQVLKGTREHLKYLTNTDLMAAAQLVSPPSVDVFLAYGILPEQVSGFTVYVMGCLAADPNRLNVPLPILIADLSSTWAIVPPRKKEAYSELANIFRPHLPPRAADIEDKAARAAEVSTAVATRKLGPKLKATRKNAASVDADVRVRTPVPPLRHGRGFLAKSSAAATDKALVPRVVCSSSKRLQAQRRMTTTSASAPASSSPSLSSPAAAATQLSTLPRGAKREESASKTAACRNNRSGSSAISSSQFQPMASLPQLRRQPALRPVDKAATAALAEELQLPDTERAAFCRFAETSLHEMVLALSALPVPHKRNHRSGSSKAKRSAKTQPRGVQLLMKEWLPIAAEEWARKTRRQKSFYMRD
ncbi:conserved hypothetical protein [Leishmania braziliensis MHOM/BR/75/M2904]|uniref:Uncharacterized protein n=2 Tax=Leishmania braziliensis TaxID=5660 RepID=A4HBQ4_LEIBR|nr:conserved hypothetical protein [Leishmania braziliensis MHOM/BR/75/M2904]KAI5690473.1 hypothetical protein MNV84_03562 [Leishmania braziliensis]CAJ2472425.1 unnamed protein product [Leishmania braziliensis]CAM38843.1 conserved hypothetical protein [Leishmania braziliensis MHOM/BR/75/M2904]SYZ65664.1 hypothetical_protein [Leishmania braziliensis MHOM/BR/75/M2904]